MIKECQFALQKSTRLAGEKPRVSDLYCVFLEVSHDKIREQYSDQYKVTPITHSSERELFMLAILDYEAGNQTSVQRGLSFLGITSTITSDPAVLRQAKGVIFPGVGAAGQAMDMLHRNKLDDTLRLLVAEKKPLLGVCLGCQILLTHSEENDTKGLGILPGECLRFSPSLNDENGEPICIPHMGWNSLKKVKESPILNGIPDDAEFYFVHSFYTEPEESLVIATTHHGIDFCSIYGREGLWALQFHPEKSGPYGLKIMQNFYDYCCQQA